MNIKTMLKGFVLLMTLPFYGVQIIAQDLDLAQTPLAVETEGVSPNIMLIIDESGSMDNNDVFYAPGYDASREYRCTSSTNRVLKPLAGNTVVVHVSRASGSSGVPYFSYENGQYYTWGNNTASSVGGFSINAGNICFDPDETYQVRLQANTQGSVCNRYENQCVEQSCSSWRWDSCASRDWRGRCVGGNVCATYSCSKYANVCVEENNNFYYATGDKEDFDGNFLNWYFSNANSDWADNTITGGYPTTWEESYANNFNTSGGNRGLKQGVSYSHDRNDVARDVAKKVVREIDDAYLGLVSYSSNSNAIKLRHGLVALESKNGEQLFSNRKLSLLSAINNIGKSGGTPTGSTILGVANYLFTGWPKDSTEFDFNKTETETESKTLTDAFGSFGLYVPNGTPGYNSTTQHITSDLWCKKNALAVLTDGEPTVETTGITDLFSNYVPIGVEKSTFNALSNSTGGSNSGSNCPLCRKNLIRTVGALYDHDFLENVKQKQNIETFMIAFGEPSILEKEEFKMAGKAGGGGSDNFYPARDGAAVNQAFNDIVSRVKAASASVTAIAVSAVSELKTDNYAVQATYATEYWNSVVKGLRLNQKGQFINPTDDPSAENVGSDSSTDTIPMWESNDVLNRLYVTNGAAEATRSVKIRQVYTWNGTDGVRFGGDNIVSMSRPSSVTASFSAFNALPVKIQNDLRRRAGNNSQEQYDLMMYLLGDVTHEVGYVGEEKYRRRGVYQLDGSNRITAVNKGGFLGDIVHSSPVYVKEPPRPWDDVHFGTELKLYSKFKEEQANRAAMVYAGSNRGFLHAITVEDGVRNSLSFPAGSELFAYMPSMLASTQPNEGFHYLANKKYEHRFYVDLTPTVGDVFMDFYSDGSEQQPIAPEWRTVLVGGLRAGGKGLFALDITCPYQTVAAGNTCDDEQFGASNVLWEFSDVDDSDLGFTYGEPVIAKVYYDTGEVDDGRNGNGSGRWAAIVSNGYNSLNGRAVLFILFLDGGLDGTWTKGVDYIKLYASTAADDNSGSKNGLSSATAIDIDGDGVVDHIYAGDLKGQMWTFDVSQSVVYVED